MPIKLVLVYAGDRSFIYHKINMLPGSFGTSSGILRYNLIFFILFIMNIIGLTNTESIITSSTSATLSYLLHWALLHLMLNLLQLLFSCLFTLNPFHTFGILYGLSTSSWYCSDNTSSFKPTLIIPDRLP